jgi:Lon protease-like protein
VRLPTETLTLNLYEERYLQMAEFILKSKYRLFGALFTPNKPQVVARGTGPIVPMVESGDIGVICRVVNDEEALIPTVGSTPRRRIRLIATAISRFQIQTILHNGYDTSEGFLPYILVEGKVMVDYPESSLDEEIVNAFVRGNRLGKLSQNELKALLLSLERVLPDVSDVELKSFALASSKLPESASQERLDVLNGQDRRERLRCLQ